jgi:hypothetical protein
MFGTELPTLHNVFEDLKEHKDMKVLHENNKNK